MAVRSEIMIPRRERTRARERVSCTDILHSNLITRIRDLHERQHHHARLPVLWSSYRFKALRRHYTQAQANACIALNARAYESGIRSWGNKRHEFMYKVYAYRLDVLPLVFHCIPRLAITFKKNTRPLCDRRLISITRGN